MPQASAKPSYSAERTPTPRGSHSYLRSSPLQHAPIITVAELAAQEDACLQEPARRHGIADQVPAIVQMRAQKEAVSGRYPVYVLGDAPEVVLAVIGRDRQERRIALNQVACSSQRIKFSTLDIHLDVGRELIRQEFVYGDTLNHQRAGTHR